MRGHHEEHPTQNRLPVPVLRAVNTTVTCSYGVPFDLNHVARTLCNTYYDPNVFRAVVIKYKQCSGTVLLFRTGRAVGTGLEAAQALSHTQRALQRIGYKAYKNNERLVNSVYSGAFARPLDLRRLRCGIYEPDVFTNVRIDVLLFLFTSVV